MKATISKSNFAKALGSVSRIVAARTTLPVLGNILISADKSGLTLGSTDLEVAIKAKAEAQVTEEGKITIPSRLLSDFVLNNPDESLDLALTNLTLSLKSAKYEANIKGIDAEEFPTIPEVPTAVYAEIPVELLADALKKVIIAAANDDTRPVLAGVYMKFEGKTLTMAATDSYRLSEKKIDLPKEFEKREVIVPQRTMNELNRLLSGVVGKTGVKIILDENQVFFILGEVQIVSRLIEGAFPNYEQIIPSNSKITVKCNLAEALGAIKMSALFAKDMANNIKIKVEKDGMVVKSAAEQVGDTLSHVAAKTNGGEIEVAFNARYLIDALNVMAGEGIEFALNDDSSAAVIKDEKDKEFVYLAMPLKTE